MMKVPDASAPRLVSVVTPCYNAADFIEQTIDSVRAQTYGPIEHIVVENGSTDNSWDAIQRALGRHPAGVRAYRMELNGGGAAARNFGVARAGGEFLIFLDADDLISPTSIAMLVAAANDNPGAIVYCPWARLISTAEGWRTRPAEIPLPRAAEDPLRGWLEGAWLPTCSILWPRDVYERAGGWDEEITLNDDGDLMMRALAAGAKLVPAAGGESYYRSHGADRPSVSSVAHSADRLLSGARVLEKLTAQLAALGSVRDYAPALGTAYHRLALFAFQQANPELGREWRAIGERFGGRQAVSRTRTGRLLARMIGIERKEALVDRLARLGVGSRQRRDALRLREKINIGDASVGSATGTFPSGSETHSR